MDTIYFKMLKEMVLNEDLDSIYNNYYANSFSREEFDKLIRLDPTFQEERNKLGNYGKWILDKRKNGALSDEDVERASEVLNDFNDRRKYLKGEEEPDKGKDISRYKNLQEISDALDSIQLTDNQRAKLIRKQSKLSLENASSGSGSCGGAVVKTEGGSITINGVESDGIFYGNFLELRNYTPSIGDVVVFAKGKYTDPENSFSLKRCGTFAKTMTFLFVGGTFIEQ